MPQAQAARIITSSNQIEPGVIIDSDINASAAIALSKLATGAIPTGLTVTNANIVAAAAIALSKLATGTKGAITTTNGSTRQDLGVGTNDQVLTADSAQSLGIKWAAAAGGTTAKFDNYFIGGNFNNVVTGSWARTFNGSDLFWVTNNATSSDGAQNNEISFNGHLKSGTYTVIIFCTSSNNKGIAHIEVDGTEETTFDMYTSGVDESKTIVNTSIAIAGDGDVAIDVKMASKNGSSSGYACVLQGLLFLRTGA